ncbi:DUF2332 domain-containing protein [Alicyclobacillus mali (ex Roth et al. 2021)]|uniref:DUF2332 domain-containing protein n=1 Tax=Alicyclobacillus mali (ex Roth et al. 2021) TaxID=1123961 RepID=UPI001A8E0893|nr:DUF2332 domain-containing protein [Alicyclobacillus mali (ex Roth et al. 2021)]
MKEMSLSERFERFALTECKGNSRLYEFLSLQVSAADDLLELSSHCRRGQPIPNLFFASIHYLLLKGVHHELKAYYPDLVASPLSVDQSFGAFRDFCHRYREDIVAILQTRIVQTNEIRRCTYLYPSFCSIHNITRKPLSLIEIGTSAGLQLLWDKFKYAYGSPEVYGDQESPVHLVARLKNDVIPPLSRTSPPVAFRAGIDLHVINLSDEDDYLWLKALIWPEHVERRRWFEQAAEMMKRCNDVQLIEGDGLTVLPEVVTQIPEDSTLCVFHTHVANQFTIREKEKLVQILRDISFQRPVFHLFNNLYDAGKLHLALVHQGVERDHIVAEIDGHGRWFAWLANV